MSITLSFSFLPSKYHPRTSRCHWKNSYRSHLSYACAKESLKELSLPPKVVTCLDSIKWDDKGWAVAIAQNVDTGAVLMQGFVNRDAVAMTISSRKATFCNHSRSTLWIKGETSNNFINVHEIFFDCNRDSIEEQKLGGTTLYALESRISLWTAELAMPQSEKPSGTKRLLLGRDLLRSKLSREEVDKLCGTVEENEDKSRTTSKMADVLYHAMVVLATEDVKLEVVRKRLSETGI